MKSAFLSLISLDLIVIPDLEEDPNEISSKMISQPPQAGGKIQNLIEINQMEKQYTLPQPVSQIF